MANWKLIRKKAWRASWQLTLMFLVLLCILEIAYRYQWIDFFRTEVRALNPKVNPKKPHVLVFGDSFTAHPEGYVDYLRTAHPKINFINCALPGSGPYEMELIAARRIEKYPPKCVIYQLYLGNDLTDIQAPVNWGKLSISRNVYWTAKDYFKIFGLFSRRLSGVQGDFDPNTRSQDDQPFSIQKYSARSQLMIQANPRYLNQCVHVAPEFADAMERCKESLNYLRSLVPKNVPIYLVVIPHCSQVNATYGKRFVAMGAKRTSRDAEYPFVQQLRKMKGFHTLNPLLLFRTREAEGKIMYFNNDPHLTDEGQRQLFLWLNGFLSQEWKRIEQ